MNSKFLKWAGCLAAMFALAACSSEEMADSTQLPEGKYPITFTATGLEVTPVTRATADGTWTEGDKVAVHLKGDNVDETRQYKASATGSTVTLVSNDSQGTFYWQNTSDSYNVTAWSRSYPIDYFSVPATQNDPNGTKYQEADFLYAHGTLAFNDNQPLTFYHQTAKVVVHVISGDDIPKDMSIKTLKTSTLSWKMKNWTAPTGNAHYGTGEAVIDASLANFWPLAFNAGEVTLPNNTKTTPLKSYKFLIVPQTVKGGSALFFIHPNPNEDTPFIYTPTADIEWKAGTEYTYYITIKATTGLDVTVKESIDWESGTTGSGSVTIEEPVDLTAYANEVYTVPQNASVVIDGKSKEQTKRIVINDGAQVTLKNVKLTAPSQSWTHAIEVKGSSTIILSGENEIIGDATDASCPIAVTQANATLTINGTINDKLTLTAKSTYGVGLGAANKANLIINGGTIITNGGIGAAAIGGSALLECGDITINGGDITATGGRNSAAIGSGVWEADRTGCVGDCGNITINGGKISATGNSDSSGESGIGIGSGYRSTCGDITITGGDITATAGSGKYGGAGIGSGIYGTCGNITITGGTIEATGKNGIIFEEGNGYNSGAGIGAAAEGKYVSIKISGINTSVKATGGNGSDDIGYGFTHNSTPPDTHPGTVTIAPEAKANVIATNNKIHGN